MLLGLPFIKPCLSITLPLLMCNLHSSQEALLLPAQLCASPVKACFLQKALPAELPWDRIMSKQQSCRIAEVLTCLSSSFPSSHSHMILSLEMKHESVGNCSQLDDCISCQPKYWDCVNTQIFFTNQAVRKFRSKRRHLRVFCAISSHNRLPEMTCFLS